VGVERGDDPHRGAGPDSGAGAGRSGRDAVSDRARLSAALNAPGPRWLDVGCVVVAGCTLFLAISNAVEGNRLRMIGQALVTAWFLEMARRAAGGDATRLDGPVGAARHPSTSCVGCATRCGVGRARGPPYGGWMDVEPGGTAGDGRGGASSSGPSSGSSRVPPAPGTGDPAGQGARSKVWAVLAVAAAGYFVVGGVWSLIDGNSLQGGFRLAAAAFLGSWLVRQHHGSRARRPSPDEASAGRSRPEGRDGD